jgi:hypothetical protein
MRRRSSTSAGLCRSLTAMPKLLAAFALFASLVLGVAGRDTCECNTGQVCIKGGTCARSCKPDDGGQGDCPTGQLCQLVSGNCHGTACTAVAVPVCCPGDGGCM